jgi:hypothetical protein
MCRRHSRGADARARSGASAEPPAGDRQGGPVGAQAPDLVGQHFSLRDKPNQVWVGDLIDIPNEEGPLYLASVLDSHSRLVVGFAMDAHHDTERARAAWCMAMAVRGGEVAGLVLPHRPGRQYTEQLFASACTHVSETESMARAGSALDNAVAENFHSASAFEPLRGACFATGPRQGQRSPATWSSASWTVGTPPEGRCPRSQARVPGQRALVASPSVAALRSGLSSNSLLSPMHALIGNTGAAPWVTNYVRRYRAHLEGLLSYMTPATPARTALMHREYCRAFPSGERSGSWDATLSKATQNAGRVLVADLLRSATWLRQQVRGLTSCVKRIRVT